MVDSQVVRPGWQVAQGRGEIKRAVRWLHLRETALGDNRVLGLCRTF